MGSLAKPRSTLLASCGARRRESFRDRRALAQRVLQVDRNAVLFQHVGKCFIRQFLDRCHPVASKLFQLVESVVVEGDQLPHHNARLSKIDAGSMAAGPNGSGREPALHRVVERPQTEKQLPPLLSAAVASHKPSRGELSEIFPITLRISSPNCNVIAARAS
jgi:hypothetical protein